MMQTEETTKVCPACGLKLAWDAPQCIHCAYDFESPPMPSAFAPMLNRYAIASVALAVLWLGGLGSIAAIYIGRAALVQIAASRNREVGTEWAIVGIVAGWVGIATSLLVAALLLLG